MKTALIALLLMAVTATARAQEKQEFLSWYNGWGVHTLWGIGKVQGSYFGSTMKCGSALIPIRAVYDTHQDTDPPTATQSRKHVEAENLALLRTLEANRTKCIFQIIKH
jgi:hypothetical protein